MFLLLPAGSRKWEKPFLKLWGLERDDLRSPFQPKPFYNSVFLPNRDPEIGLQLAECWNFFNTWEVFCKDYTLNNGKMKFQVWLGSGGILGISNWETNPFSTFLAQYRHCQVYVKSRAYLLVADAEWKYIHTWQNAEKTITEWEDRDKMKQGGRCCEEDMKE